MGIKNLLNRGDGFRGVRLAKRSAESSLGSGRERFAEIIRGLNESLDLRLERLKIHIADFRKCLSLCDLTGDKEAQYGSFP